MRQLANIVLPLSKEFSCHHTKVQAVRFLCIEEWPLRSDTSSNHSIGMECYEGWGLLGE